MLPCTSGWSSWINRVDPVVSTGDYEKMTKEELNAFCPGGNVTDIECKDSDTNDDWTSLAEAICSVDDGLKCNKEYIRVTGGATIHTLSMFLKKKLQIEEAQKDILDLNYDVGQCSDSPFV
ncbi:hypothetical protein Btru_016733 [Bulinus truncatus]|nr:hypothetical protein Btru_016733 [Bulinus truncatus]